jgi:hypothetical protein
MAATSPATPSQLIPPPFVARQPVRAAGTAAGWVSQATVFAANQTRIATGMPTHERV